MPAKNAVLLTAYRDGPLLVRGPAQVLDREGRPIGGQRRPIALCRCGKSRLWPTCDGTHKLIGFRAPGGSLALDPPEASGS
ncbi:MAG: CDGSH iron-sulfur domain-containing protein [Solirubrobacterales bacterium]|nr:CDGSH iron-sulfur domain-containing protein [Solirubrobacterales bacterium]MBV9915536.1 CDGSH iron-sulfur domain-containing protein [Solirubrobacterales bacterium]